MFLRPFCTVPATPRSLAPPPRAGRLGRGERFPTSRAAPQSAQWLSRTYVFCIPPRYHLAKTSLTPRSRDVPCPCSWARWASGGGAAVRVGRLRPRGVVSAAMAACRDRIRLPTRALSLCRDPSLVVNGRSSSSSPPLAAATCPCRPCDPVFHPPAPPHHPCVMERRCPAAGGVKHARGGVRQGVITHHPLVPSGTHDGQGLAPTTRACVAPRAA